MGRPHLEVYLGKAECWSPEWAIQKGQELPDLEGAGSDQRLSLPATQAPQK